MANIPPLVSTSVTNHSDVNSFKIRSRASSITAYGVKSEDITSPAMDTRPIIFQPSCSCLPSHTWHFLRLALHYPLKCLPDRTKLSIMQVFRGALLRVPDCRQLWREHPQQRQSQLHPSRTCDMTHQKIAKGGSKGNPTQEITENDVSLLKCSVIRCNRERCPLD
jgi:hypothetical protein